MARLALVIILAASAACATPVQRAGMPPPQPSDDAFLTEVYRSDQPGLVRPKAIHTVHPKYTREAMQQKIQGIVVVEAVVLPNGTVGRARVQKSLDTSHGLDAAALEAARMWRFEAGTLRGNAVPVAIVIELEFRLH